MAQPSKAISFRLPPSVVKELLDEGAKYGESPAEYARRLVLASLSDKERARALEELSGLRELVERMRSDLATAVSALLVGAGKVSKNEAEEWVRKTLLR